MHSSGGGVPSKSGSVSDRRIPDAEELEISPIRKTCVRKKPVFLKGYLKH
jgi:hypothetical protein